MGFKDVTWNLTDGISAKDKLEIMSQNDELNARLARFLPQGLISDTGDVVSIDISPTQDHTQPVPGFFTNSFMQNAQQVGNASLSFTVLKNRMISINAFMFYCYVVPVVVSTVSKYPKPQFFFRLDPKGALPQNTGGYFYPAIATSDGNMQSGSISLTQYFCGAADPGLDTSQNVSGVLPTSGNPYVLSLWVQSDFDSTGGNTTSEFHMDSRATLNGRFKLWVMDHGADRAWEPKIYAF